MKMERAMVILAGLLVVYALGCRDSAKEKEDQLVAAYRNAPSGVTLFPILHDLVRPGDSVERVQQLLGPGHDDPSAFEPISRFAQKHPQEFADGMQATDRLVRYCVDKDSFTYLQFREGRLVNFHAEEYSHYEPSYSASASSPSS